jgi:cobalt/nickel transport system permease protein
MFALSVSVLLLSVRRINRRFDERLVPYMGVLAAVTYAAQLVNFPVPPASSGHLLGSTLLAVMVGPWAAIVIIALVLLVQAMAGDGGLLTYGLNLFNMGVLACPVGWLVARALFRLLKSSISNKSAILIAAAVASYISVLLSAFTLGLELLTVPGFGVGLLIVLVAIHAVIGIGEAALTYVILLYFTKAHPDMIVLLRESEALDSVVREGVAPVLSVP